MNELSRDLFRLESEALREAEADARACEEAWARAAADEADDDLADAPPEGPEADDLADAPPEGPEDIDPAIVPDDWHVHVLTDLDLPDDEDRHWWAALNTAFHSTPPTPRYYGEPWDVADGFFRVIDSHGDVPVSTHFGLDGALRLLEVLNNPAFGDDAPTDPDPAGEARGGLAGHDAEAGR